MSADELLLEQRIRLGALFDRYEKLLTQRQRNACELLLHQDLTFTELADQLEVTRQGAFDLVRRARDQMEEVEQVLGVIRMHRCHQALLGYLEQQKEQLPPTVITQIKNLLEESTNDV